MIKRLNPEQAGPQDLSKITWPEPVKKSSPKDESSKDTIIETNLKKIEIS